MKNIRIKKSPGKTILFQTWTKIVIFYFQTKDKRYDWTEQFWITCEHEKEAEEMFQNYIKKYFEEKKSQINNLQFVSNENLVLLNNPVKHQKSIFNKIIEMKEKEI